MKYLRNAFYDVCPPKDRPTIAPIKVQACSRVDCKAVSYRLYRSDIL